MRLKSLTLTHLRMPLVNAFETSFGRITHRECILVALQSEGLTGYGECVADRDPGYCYETTGTAWHILKDFVAPLILGQDISDANDFQRRVDGIRGHQLAKAGVEMAIWDLLGKRAGKSLRGMLGGERTSKKGAPSNIPEIEVVAGEHSILNLLVSHQLATSRSDARRLVEQGGVKIDQRPITDWEKPIAAINGAIIQVGKRHFVKLRVKT